MSNLEKKVDALIRLCTAGGTKNRKSPPSMNWKR